MVALLAVLALVACGSPSVQAVARYDNVTLSRQDLDQRIDRIETALKKQEGAQVPSRLDIEKELVTGANGFISQNLLLAVAKQHGVTVTDKEIDNTISQFRTSVAQGANGQSFDEVVQGALGLPGGDSSEFRQFASFFVARQKLAETLVTTDTVRQQVTDQVMAEAGKQVMTANVAHILVNTEAEANTVIDRLNKGEKFEDLAKELSTDPGSKDNGGLYENVQQGQMVAEFDKATFEDLKPGETTKTPVKTQFGYHIIRLISRSEGPAMTPEQAKQAIEQGIGQQLQQSRGTALEKLLADERDKAKKDGRLIEPTYPEPTAAPAQPTEPAAPAVPTPAS
ncbi:MAG: peptidylprolyl isomerase [Kouleothrix sp.]|nr:peptidylprolyl isomerase [Kouleothrix sp.]